MFISTQAVLTASITLETFKFESFYLFTFITSCIVVFSMLIIYVVALFTFTYLGHWYGVIGADEIEFVIIELANTLVVQLSSKAPRVFK